MDTQTRLQLETEAIVASQRRMEPVEALLDAAEARGEVSREQAAALWLWGWSLLPPRMQQRIARAHLADARQLAQVHD